MIFLDKSNFTNGYKTEQSRSTMRCFIAVHTVFHEKRLNKRNKLALNISMLESECERERARETDSA